MVSAYTEALFHKHCNLYASECAIRTLHDCRLNAAGTNTLQVVVVGGGSEGRDQSVLKIFYSCAYTYPKIALDY